MTGKKKKSEIYAEEILGTASEKEFFERLGNLRETKENLRALSKARSSLKDGAVKDNLDRWFFGRKKRRELTPIGEMTFERLDVKKMFAWFAFNANPSPELFNVENNFDRYSVGSFDIGDEEYVFDEAAKLYEEMDETDVDAALSMIDAICERYSGDNTPFGGPGHFLTNLVSTAFVVFDVRIAEKTAEKLASLPATIQNIEYLARVESLDALYDTSESAGELVDNAYREKLTALAPTLDAPDFLSLPKTGTDEPTERCLAFNLLEKNPSIDILVRFASRIDMPNDARFELLKSALETGKDGAAPYTYPDIRNIYLAASEIIHFSRNGEEKFHLPVVLAACRFLASFKEKTDVGIVSLPDSESGKRGVEEALDIVVRSIVGSLSDVKKENVSKTDLVEMFDFLDVFESCFDRTFVGCDSSDAGWASVFAAHLVSMAADVIAGDDEDDEVLLKCMIFVGSRWFGDIEPSGGAKFVDSMARLGAAVAKRAEEEGAEKETPAL